MYTRSTYVGGRAAPLSGKSSPLRDYEFISENGLGNHRESRGIQGNPEHAETLYGHDGILYGITYHSSNFTRLITSLHAHDALLSHFSPKDNGFLT